MRPAFKALLLAAAISGCAVSPNGDVASFADGSGNNSFEVFNRSFDSQALVLPVVHDRQTEGPACGAHALASVVNYWRGAGTLDGSTLFRAHPPSAESGYSIAEMMSLAAQEGLLASAVQLPQDAIIRELENGRPVIVPVHLPSIYVQRRVLPGSNLPVLGLAASVIANRAAKVSEWSTLAMVDHYLVIAGYQDNTFVVVEPVAGYRTIRFDRLERYRRAFGDAAIVFSAQNAATAHAAEGSQGGPSR